MICTLSSYSLYSSGLSGMIGRFLCWSSLWDQTGRVGNYASIARGIIAKLTDKPQRSVIAFLSEWSNHEGDIIAPKNEC